MDDIPVDADRFGFVFGSLIDDVARNIDRVPEKSVRKAAKVARDETKNHAHVGRTPWSERYRDGFAYKVKGKGMESEAEVGNKAKPGLVHLLEKGHAKVGGGKTRAFPHLGPGYEAGAEAFVEAAERETERALRG